MSRQFDPVEIELDHYLTEQDRDAISYGPCEWCGEPATDLKTVTFNSCAGPAQRVRACERCRIEERSDVVTMIFNSEHSRILRKWMKSKREKI